MKRVTTRYEDGVQIGTARFKYGCTIAPARAAFGLANYEDTGYTPDEIIALNHENQGLKANSLIQQHIIERNSNPLDKDKIVKLIMENTALKSENERLRVQLERAKRDINEWGPCALCKNFIQDEEDERECILGGCEYGKPEICREPLGFKWRGEESE